MPLPRPFAPLPGGAARPDTRSLTLSQLTERFKRLRQAQQLAFHCVHHRDADDFIQQLKVRAKNPFAIRQGGAPLCGPAAFLFCVASAYPEVYQRYVLELAIHGEARRGKLRVTPSGACRNAQPEHGIIHPVDWVALASLRDSTNRLLSMRGAKSNAAGITLPGAIAAWFAESGLFGSVENHTRLFPGASADTLLLADRKHRQGASVCLFVRASILAEAGVELGNKLGKGTPKTLAPVPDHWIVQTAPMYLEHRQVPTPFEALVGNEDIDVKTLPLDFSVHSWGFKDKPLQINSRINPMTLQKLLPYYYGFVSARPVLGKA